MRRTRLDARFPPPLRVSRSLVQVSWEAARAENWVGGRAADYHINHVYLRVVIRSHRLLEKLTAHKGRCVSNAHMIFFIGFIFNSK